MVTSIIGVVWRRVSSLVTVDDGSRWHGSMTSRCGVGDGFFVMSPWRTSEMRYLHMVGLARVVEMDEGLWIGGLGLDGGMGLNVGL